MTEQERIAALMADGISEAEARFIVGMDTSPEVDGVPGAGTVLLLPDGPAAVG